MGPDSDNEAKFHFSKVERYGVVWETALKTFWADPNVSLHEMAWRLGIKHKTVKYHADRLNLPLPRQANRPVGICSETTRWRSQLPKPKMDRLKLYREEWLLVRKNYPTAKLYELRKLAPRAYEWLDKNDAKWFGEHYPPSIRVFTPPTEQVQEAISKGLLTLSLMSTGISSTT